MEKQFVCQKCNKTFKSKNGYEGHVKKDICGWVKVYECPKCKKRFTNFRSYKYHCENVVCVIEPRVIVPIDVESKKKEIISGIRSMLAYDTSIVAEIAKEFQEQLSTVPTININSGNVITNNNNTIIYNIAPAFLEMETAENIRKYCHGAMEKSFEYILEPYGLTKIISQTICNPLHPIFNSVYMESMCDGNVKVSDGEKYINRHLPEVISELVIKKMTVMIEEIPKNHVNGLKIAEKCNEHIYMFKHAPKYPDEGVKSKIRLMSYNDFKFDFIKLFNSAEDYIKDPKWVKKLNIEMKKMI